MPSNGNKAVARRFFASFEANDQGALNAVLAPGLVAHVPHVPGAPGPVNREALVHTIGMFHAAFSDHHYEIEDQIAEGDKVVTRTTWRATHSGDFQGLPPTGKRIAISGIAIERIQDGKIVERWVSFDQLDLMRQLGLVPPPPPAG